jgi:threonine/homoserine/homoserine lactone efflux protein
VKQPVVARPCCFCQKSYTEEMPPTLPWIPLLSYAFVVAITPGPNNIVSMNNARNVGFKRHIPMSIGIFIGYCLVMSLCLFFSAFLLKVVPQIELPMKIAGAAYMVHIIIKILLPAQKKEVKDRGGNFFMGIVLGLINPKFIIFGITVASSYITPYVSGPMLFLFAALLASIAAGSTLCWAAFGSVFSAMFHKHGKIINIVMSLLLLYCVVSLFL